MIPNSFVFFKMDSAIDMLLPSDVIDSVIPSLDSPVKASPSVYGTYAG